MLLVTFLFMLSKTVTLLILGEEFSFQFAFKVGENFSGLAAI